MFVTVISADQENDADVLGVLAASTALAISPIPWDGPIAAVRVGQVEGNWILNPTFQQLEFSTIDLFVTGSADSIVMVEGGALEISEKEVLDALKIGQKGIKELVGIAQKVIAKAAKPTMEWTKAARDPALTKRVEELAEKAMAKAINAKDKAGRAEGVAKVKASVVEQLATEFPDQGRNIGNEIEEVEYRVMRAQVLDKGERVDGRDMDTVRPITIETSLLPRAHGSSLFTRGQTQALVAVTLGTADDEQRIDTIDVPRETTKSFMLHYNFPPYCTGEVKMIRGTSRREIGHGMLAERALQPLLPRYEEFPYTMRIVSEVLESNGSSSMATVCGGSLSLMDAGVPMKAACAGVAMGLIKEGKKIAILTDILGTEDHLGDMDFKVAGTDDRHHLDPDGHQDPGPGPEDHGRGARQGAPGPPAHPRRNEEGARHPPARDVAVGAADLHPADQARQDRRPHRPQGQDDPRHPGGHGRQDQRRGLRPRHHRRRRRRGRREGPGDGHRHRAPSPRSARSTKARSRAPRRSAPSSRSCRASRGCCTSASSSTAAPTRRKTWSRRATSSRSSSSRWTSAAG